MNTKLTGVKRIDKRGRNKTKISTLRPKRDPNAVSTLRANGT